MFPWTSLPPTWYNTLSSVNTPTSRMSTGKGQGNGTWVLPSIIIRYDRAWEIIAASSPPSLRQRAYALYKRPDSRALVHYLLHTQTTLPWRLLDHHTHDPPWRRHSGSLPHTGQISCKQYWCCVEGMYFLPLALVSFTVMFIYTRDTCQGYLVTTLGSRPSVKV